MNAKRNVQSVGADLSRGATRVPRCVARRIRDFPQGESGLVSSLRFAVVIIHQAQRAVGETSTSALIQKESSIISGPRRREQPANYANRVGLIEILVPPSRGFLRDSQPAPREYACAIRS